MPPKVSRWLSIAWRMLFLPLVLLVPAGTGAADGARRPHLHRELTGYPEYAQKTRFRLIPGLW